MSPERVIDYHIENLKGEVCDNIVCCIVYYRVIYGVMEKGRERWEDGGS